MQLLRPTTCETQRHTRYNPSNIAIELTYKVLGQAPRRTESQNSQIFGVSYSLLQSRLTVYHSVVTVYVHVHVHVERLRVALKN